MTTYNDFSTFSLMVSWPFFSLPCFLCMKPILLMILSDSHLAVSKVNSHHWESLLYKVINVICKPVTIISNYIKSVFLSVSIKMRTDINTMHSPWLPLFQFKIFQLYSGAKVLCFRNHTSKFNLFLGKRHAVHDMAASLISQAASLFWGEITSILQGTVLFSCDFSRLGI